MKALLLLPMHANRDSGELCQMELRLLSTMYPATLAAAKQPPRLPVNPEPQTSTVDMDTLAKDLQTLRPVVPTEQDPDGFAMESLGKSLPNQHNRELELTVKYLDT